MTVLNDLLASLENIAGKVNSSALKLGLVVCLVIVSGYCNSPKQPIEAQN